MECIECQHENREGRRFCAECGAPLSQACSACTFVNEPGEKFCGGCGIAITDSPSLSAPVTAPASISPVTTETEHQLSSDAPQSSVTTPAPVDRVESSLRESHPPEAERRQLTVMFCDLVDSTALSGQLDPEDLRDVIRAYQTACTEVIHRFDGNVAQLLGDGLLVYFGYPQAHEDDAQRAIHAGLGMIDVMGILNQRLEREQGVRLAVRVGVHTGLVVIGDMGGEGRQEQLALGETPNIAARIQGLAESDTVVISRATHQLAQGYFEYEMLGEHLLRGVAEPIVVFRIRRASGVQSRLDVATPRGLTPLVGRESEVALLLDRWGQVQDGLGQVVLLRGEAGIGKSRLVQVLKEHVATTPHAQLECRSSPYYQNTALYPITDLLQRTMGWEPDDTAAVQLHKLEEALGRYRLAMEEAVPLMAGLLSLPLPEDRYRSLDLTPQRQRQKMLETLVTMLMEESERQPVLFIIEDLHWTDPTTLELLEYLFDQCSRACMLTLLTCRPEFEPPSWSRRSSLTEVALSRLSKRQMERMVERVANGKRLPDEVLRELVEKTDGVPLYLEEMTKAVIESGVLKEHEHHYELAGAVASLAIPATLQDSLMARLDRLESAKGVAQLGAVIGRQFSYELLYTVSELDEATLQRELRRLVDAELVYQRGALPGATYLFKHALVQDTAYESLLRSTRQQYHRRIIDGLIERFPEAAETQPELLAHHFTEAGLNDEAVNHWQKAGQKAVEGLAYEEAIQHLNRALEMLPTLPQTPGRNQLELGMLLALERALRAVKGRGEAEEAILTRAQELCQQAEDSLELFGVLRSLAAFHIYRANFQTALELLEQCRLLAQRLQDPACLQQVRERRGLVWWVQGELIHARDDFEKAITLHHLHGPHAHLMTRMDPGVRCRSCTYLAVVLSIVGYPDQALMRIREGLALAQELSHPHQLCNTLSWTAMFYVHRREPREAQGYAATCITLATEQGFPQWLSEAGVALGGALVMQGQGEVGMEHMRQGQDDIQAAGTQILVPQHLTLRAEAHLNLGQPETGLALVGEALRLVDKTGMKYDASTLHRLKGELLLQLSSDHTVEAETCFHQAIAIAQHQSAKSWELRAAMSMARLWQSQDKRQDAYDLLAPVYGWFTEGFDTADLIDAKALLTELSEGR